MSAHGAAKALNREPLGIFFFLFFILILFIPVHENHKHFLVWENIVSAQEAATDLNRENSYSFLFVYINFIFLFIKCINIS